MTALGIALILALHATATPTPGVATWYDDGPGLYGAAGPALRHGDWRGSRVRVCHADRCVTVTLRDWCACKDRPGGPTVIDLSPDAFRALAPLSRGVVPVSVHRAQPRETDGAPRSLGSDGVSMPTPLAGDSVEFVRRIWFCLWPLRMVPI